MDDSKTVGKKVKKVLDSMTENYDKNYKKIIKIFGSTNYEYEGNSLYHLLSLHEFKKSKWRIYWAIETLRKYGLDPNVCNNQNKNFLQTADILVVEDISYIVHLYDRDIYKNLFKEMNLNNRDNNGRTILHNLLEKGIDINALSNIYFRIEKLIDPTIKDNEGKTFMDLIDEEITNMNLNDYELAFLIALKNSYYETNFECFVNKLDDEPSKVDTFLNFFFGSERKKEAHFWCADNKNASENDKLKAIERLYDLGVVSPNQKDFSGFSIISNVINSDSSPEYVLKLFKLSLEHGYCVEDASNVMERCLRVYKNYKDMIDIYVLLSKCGYDKLAYDIETSEIENAEEVYQIIKNEGFLILLDELLKEHELEFDQTYLTDNELLNYIFNAEKIIKNLVENNNDYEMVKLLVDKIIEDRKNNINFVEDKISIKELTTALKIVLEESVSNVIKPMIKVLDKYN